MLRIHLPRRDVPEPFAHHPDTYRCRRLADLADAELLIHQDLPDLLRDLATLFALLARRRVEQLQDFEKLGVLRCLSLCALPGIPAGYGMAQKRLGWIYRKGIAWKEIDLF